MERFFYSGRGKQVGSLEHIEPANQPPNPVDGDDVEILELGTIQANQFPSYSEDINDIFRIRFIPESQFSPPRYSISFKAPVEGLVNFIKTNIPSMVKQEFMYKSMGILEFNYFLNKTDAFIQYIVGKYFS